MSDTPKTDIRHCESCGQVRFPSDHWQRELAAAQADAERYRWLRGDKRGRSLSVSSLEWTGNAELSDAAVDAAMKAGGK